MDPISDADLAAYLATDAWEGKAGAFGYQDGLDWVHIYRGKREQRRRPADGAFCSTSIAISLTLENAS